MSQSSFTVKARRDTYGATGHAHINTASFLSHCTTIITIFLILVRGRFRIKIHFRSQSEVITSIQ